MADAFAVQQSEIDISLLSSVLEIQRSIRLDHRGVDTAMQLIADRTRNVAQAVGVAVRLLRGDQVVYLCGSGCVAMLKGREVTVALTTAGTGTTREILSVGNAQIDNRIEAAILVVELVALAPLRVSRKDTLLQRI